MKEKKVKEKNIFSILFGNTEIDEKDELKSATDEERASIFQSKVTLSKLEKVHGGMVEEQTATKQRRKDDFTKATEAATKLYPSKEEQELLQDADKFFGNTENAKNSRAKEKSREEDDDRSR